MDSKEGRKNIGLGIYILSSDIVVDLLVLYIGLGVYMVCRDIVVDLLVLYIWLGVYLDLDLVSL